MKLSLVSSGLSLATVTFAAVVGLAPAVAHADTPPEAPVAAAPAPETVACVTGQFGDHVDGGKVAGDTGAIFTSRKAVYWLDVANTGEPTQVTLVWTLDGREVQRQSLDVGRSGHWHTWGMRPLGGAKKVDVEVLDASGRSLKKDSVESARDAS